MAAAAILNSKSGRHCFTIRPILTKFGGNLTKNATVLFRNAHLSEFKMVSAAYLNLKNVLPFLYYWTNPHQI